MNSGYRQTLIQTLVSVVSPPLLALILSVGFGALGFIWLGVSPKEGLYLFFISPVSDLYGLSELLIKVIPILLCALGLLVCFRAGVWNIGAEGQFLAGALAGGWCALLLENTTSSWAILPIVISGAMGGLLWASIAAWLKVRWNVNEILTTIMLNYIALHLLFFAVNGPLKDPNGFSFPESAIFADHLMLPLFSEFYRLNIGLISPLLICVLVSVILSKTRFGFELRALGESPAAAENAGIPVKRTVFLVFIFSGIVAGLAGVAEVTGPIGQLIPQLSVGYGYAAIICVFLGRMHPIGIVFASLILGLTFVGGEAVQMDLQMPKAISAMFQGSLLFFLLATDFFIKKRFVINQGRP